MGRPTGHERRRNAETAEGRGTPRTEPYVDVQKSWRPAFEPRFANADGRQALGVWLDASTNADRWRSANEASQIAFASRAWCHKPLPSKLP